jgi:hypothetical protein
MEAKLKSWQHRIFHDPIHEHWAVWLPQLESSGARFLRYECFSECPESHLTDTFRLWLGHPDGHSGGGSSGSGARSDRWQIDIPLKYDFAGLAADWRACFTSATYANFHADLGELAHRYSYPTTGDDAATCSGQPHQKAMSSSVAGPLPARSDGSPADLLLRFEQRVGGLKVTGVDERFRKRILKGRDGNALERCNKQGCLPDFITIGAQKGGTTSLYNYLQRYSQGIETSKREELNFFTERFADNSPRKITLRI